MPDRRRGSRPFLWPRKNLAQVRLDTSLWLPVLRVTQRHFLKAHAIAIICGAPGKMPIDHNHRGEASQPVFWVRGKSFKCLAIGFMVSLRAGTDPYRFLFSLASITWYSITKSNKRVDVYFAIL